jgi:3-oxoacyl-(acyl-carrier-protein) synthase
MSRVVITGLGVVAPNGVGLDAFTHAIKNGISGIRKEFRAIAFFKSQGNLKFLKLSLQYFTELELRNFNSSGILWRCRNGCVEDADP